MTSLAGLVAGPAQVWGAVRLVPLLRPEPIVDLRLHPELFATAGLSVVSVAPRTAYVAYVPHAFVATWTGDGSPAAAYGTQLRPADVTDPPLSCCPLQFTRRMARREDKQRLRFLPLHLAFEGYLAMQFGGPPTVWAEWNQRAIREGLSPRSEAAYAGTDIPGLDNALRIFEIHPDQCGVAVYLADALAGIFVVPHPDDYRLLHPTLLLDMYGELIHQYALFYDEVPDFRPALDAAAVTTVADLRDQVTQAHRDWRSFHSVMAGGLLGVPPGTVETVYRIGRFTLSRFLPTFRIDTDNHVGETITDEDGQVAYLKTFRLAAAQVRRGHLLATLAANDWHLDATATALTTTSNGLIGRLDRAGFGDLLRADIIDAFRNRSRRR